MNENLNTKPKIVKVAVKLLYLGFLLSMLYNFSGLESPNLILFFFYFGGLFFLTYLIGIGNSWARVPILALNFLEGYHAGLQLLIGLLVNPRLLAIPIGITLIQLLALFLLFQKASSDWFKDIKLEKKYQKMARGKPAI
ncbi:MAG: hypothetical protein ACI9S8_000808 [Chlamydiales bacterium]|jgi:hypothetical protein